MVRKAGIILKEKKGYKLISHTGKNLGQYPTKNLAKKREQQVEYFKKIKSGRVKKAGGIGSTVLNTIRNLKTSFKSGTPFGVNNKGYVTKPNSSLPKPKVEYNSPFLNQRPLSTFEATQLPSARSGLAAQKQANTPIAVDKFFKTPALQDLKDNVNQRRALSQMVIDRAPENVKPWLMPRDESKIQQSATKLSPLELKSRITGYQGPFVRDVTKPYKIPTEKSIPIVTHLKNKIMKTIASKPKATESYNQNYDSSSNYFNRDVKDDSKYYKAIQREQSKIDSLQPLASLTTKPPKQSDIQILPPSDTI